jgi:hypothetical protein
MKKYILIIVIAIFAIQSLSAQQADSTNLQTIRTQANLISGNTRDVLTNFFQLAVNDLTGDDKRFRFSSNLFAIRLKANDKLNIDSNYVRNRFWRNTNVDFDVRMNNDFKFDGAAFGVKHAIVNQRDYTISKDLSFIYRLKTNGLTDMNDSLSAYIDDALSKGIIDRPTFDALNIELNSFLKDPVKRFGTYSSTFQAIAKQAIPFKLDDDFNYYQARKSIYDELIQAYKNKLLWTIGAEAVTNKNGLFTAALLQTQATSGILKVSKYSNIEFDVLAQLEMTQDITTVKDNDLRQLFSASGYLNYVIRTFEQQPIFEIKAGSTYQKIMQGNFVDIPKEQFTLDGGIRIRVTKSIWVPLTFRYDPENANLFGYLSFKSNFDWLGALMKN